MNIDHRKIQGIGGWCLGQFTSKRTDGSSGPTVPALTRKGLAIHRNDEGEGWKLSHIRSGLKVGQFRTKSLAHACGERILAELDFEQDSSELSRDPKKFALVRRIIIVYQAEQQDTVDPYRDPAEEPERHFTREELAP